MRLHIDSRIVRFLTFVGLLGNLTGCSHVDDGRIPNYPVNLNLGDAGLWHTYGVSSFGQERCFIRNGSTRIPSGFPYSSQHATGFGGILLTQGVDPFSGGITKPLAYDLSCPVEGRQDVRVSIDSSTFDAVCAQCGSHYDVVTGAGVSVSGPASVARPQLGLRRYECRSTVSGGYIISN